MVVVVPHGVLFRGSSEKKIRKGILEDICDLLEAVIGLPSALFYGTGDTCGTSEINKSTGNLLNAKAKFSSSDGELEYSQESKNQNKTAEAGHPA